LPIGIDDSPKISALEIRGKCRRLKQQGKLDILIVDYLQLLDPHDKKVPREQQVSAMSRSMKALAKELHIPVICLSQLSRASEMRAGAEKRPQLSDLRESGAIEQDADVVIFLHRPEYYKQQKAGGEYKSAQASNEKIVSKLNGIMGGKVTDKSDDESENTEKGLMEVIVSKHRNGPTGTARMRFVSEVMGVYDWDAPIQDSAANNW